MPQNVFPLWRARLRPQRRDDSNRVFRPFGLRVDAATRWACIGFVLGVLLHNIQPLQPIVWWIPLGFGMAGFFLSWVRRWRYFSSHLASQFSLLLITCAFGLLRFDATLPTAEDPLTLRLGENVAMRVEVGDVGRYDAILRIREIDGIPVHSRSKLSVTSAGKGMKVGETWTVSCRIEKNEKTERRQVLYDARKGVFFRCRGTISAHRVSGASPWNIASVLASWRTWMSQRIDRLISGDEGALLAGILYGERGLSAEQSAAFRMAGMTHLIAVSGSNISIVIGLFVPLFLFLGYRRKSAILFSGFGVFLFSIFVGAGASVLRAALMGWLAILARVFGRRADAYHLLLLVGTILIVFDPWSLGYDAGFALSFLATWGLLVPGQIIAKRLTWIPEMGGLREAFSTTLAASLATAPFQLWAFGSVSLLGLITNLFAIPLTVFTMLWGAIACVSGDVIPFVLLPAKGLLSAMLLIARTAERFPFLVITYELPLPLFFLIMTLFLLIFELNRKKNQTYPQLESFRDCF
jgi:ComEC/Rec2-related protein